MGNKLVASLEELAVFNDKGIHWGNHTVEEIADVRQAKVKAIGELLDVALKSRETDYLRGALQNGEIEKDDSGKFVDVARLIDT